jgi:hypothetical protein
VAKKISFGNFPKQEGDMSVPIPFDEKYFLEELRHNQDEATCRFILFTICEKFGNFERDPVVMKR